MSTENLAVLAADGHVAKILPGLATQQTPLAPQLFLDGDHTVFHFNLVEHQRQGVDAQPLAALLHGLDDAIVGSCRIDFQLVWPVVEQGARSRVNEFEDQLENVGGDAGDVDHAFGAFAEILVEGFAVSG